MTDVAGPPVPPLGRSSLLIREAEAAAGELDVEADCSMVKAFEILRKTRIQQKPLREPSTKLQEKPQERPGSSRIRPKSPFHSLQAAESKYGSTLQPPQAAPVTTGMPSVAGFGPSGDRDEVNQFCRV
jgi:hypothetical protein